MDGKAAMKYQSNRSSCGPASLHNALASLGIERSEDELIKLCKQTPEGTSVRNLAAAIKAISTDTEPLYGESIAYSVFSNAWVGLWFVVAQRGRPVILCVDELDHWVACIGYLGQRFVVVDSAEVGLVFCYSKDQLDERWVSPKGKYYGLVV